MLAVFVKKETLHVIRDWRMMLMVVLVPVVQMLLFGFAISTEVNNINIAVSHDRPDETTRQATEELAANPYITLKGSVGHGDDIYQALKSGDVDAVVVFGHDGKTQIVTDASNPNLAQSAEVYISSILQNQDSDTLQTRFLYNPQLKSSFNFVPGIMGMVFILICSLMTAVAIVREKETGTMEQLLVSTVRPPTIIVAKMVPFFVLSCIVLLVTLAIARWVMEVPMTAGWLPVIVVSLLYIVLSLAIGLLVSTLSSNQVVAMLICGMVLMMPVMMLSGLIFPLDNLPIGLRQVAYVIPATYYIHSMRALMVESLAWVDVADDIIVLAGMLALVVTVAVCNFKDRLA